MTVLADEDEHRIIGACPPEQTTTLQLIQSFVRYARASHRTPGQCGSDGVSSTARSLPLPCRAQLNPSEHYPF